MGFPPGWKLPLGSRNGLRAVGNAVPVPLSAAIMRAALGETPVDGLAEADALAPSPEPASRPHPKRRRRLPPTQARIRANEARREVRQWAEAEIGFTQLPAVRRCAWLVVVGWW